MAIISKSDKFEGNQFQSCVIAGGYVILRAIYRQQDLVVMTATANETSSGRATAPYPDQTALIAIAERVFDEVGGEVSHREDRSRRPYVQTEFPDFWATLSNVANQIAQALGLSAVEIVGGDNFLADYWEDLAANPLDEDELVYLSDGTYVSKGGGLVEQ